MKEEINGALCAWDDSGIGEPLVLIHGLSETRAAWHHQVQEFSRNFRVITYDVRGFGESETGIPEGTPQQFARDVAGLLSNLGIDQACLWGFSMGGVIAMRFTIDYPRMVKALVLASSSCRINRQAVEFFKLRSSLATSDDLTGLIDLNTQDAKACVTEDRPDLVQRYIDLRTSAVQDPKGYANACAAMASLYEHPLTEDLAGIKCPTLVITGERDVFCPPKASSIIQNGIPGSNLRILPGAGHCAHWEQAATFNRIALDFLTRVGDDSQQPGSSQ